jgi:hypothetical protein
MFLAGQAQEYLVKIPFDQFLTTTSLIKQGIPVILELPDAALANLTVSQLSLVSRKNYTVLEQISNTKYYYLVYPMTNQAEKYIRNTYQVLCSGKDYFVISSQQADAEIDLARLQVRLNRIQFTPIVLSEYTPVFPRFDVNPLIVQMVANVKSDSVLSFDRRLQNFHTRYSTTDSCRAAATWLKNKYLTYGCDSVYLDNWNASYAPNVIAIKHGVAHPDNVYVVICGHFDSTSDQSPNFCPGADDNGSGTTACLETARVLKDYNFEYSIRYIVFSGEEQGLLGSYAYANAARARGDTILGVFNFDMIAYADQAQEDLDVIGKISNPNCSTFVNYFISTCSTYTQLPTLRRMVTSLAASDHHPFWQNGYVAFCGIEDYSPVNPHYHMTSDTIGAGFNSLPFCTEVIKGGVAGLASLANPIFPNRPLVVYRYCRVSDSLGNNNNRWDAGEIVKLYISLRNIGQSTAHTVYATINSSSSYISISQNQASYGNINSLDSAINMTPFVASSDSNTPIGYNAGFTLTVTSTESTWVYNFSIPIGAFMTTDPIPDGPRTPSRYWAYDNTDVSYANHPEYNWTEIKSIGTRLTFANNDQVKNVVLPSAFGNLKYYSQTYNSVSISADGWVACGFDTIPDYSNSSIPGTDGPAAMIAANWDDLVHSNTGNGGVYWYHNPMTGQFIIEWDSLSYYASSSTRDKFQIVIYDSTHSSPSVDNVILVQYQTANRYTSSTIGIKDPTETIGIQYLFDGTYHPAAALIQSGRAIKYTTLSPQGVEVSNNQLPLYYQSSIHISPNPFKGQTLISLNTPINTINAVCIYNSSGQLIKTFLVPSAHTSPIYTFNWNGKDNFGKIVNAGIYFVTTDASKNPQKLIYLR